MSAVTFSRRPEWACPHLPPFEGPVTAESMRRFRTDRGPEFYRGALGYAQSLWMEGKPAQAILQLNKALSADLRGGESVLSAYPAPYRALVWILAQDRAGEFLGNPVRHFQHLATRMSGPRAVVRAWRAWACFYLSERYLDPIAFPRDELQIRNENLRIPPLAEILSALEEGGWSGEATMVDGLLSEA